MRKILLILITFLSLQAGAQSISGAALYLGATDSLRYVTVINGVVRTTYGVDVNRRRVDSIAALLNGYVRQAGSYANPSWITSLAWAKITASPTTLAGYGISDAYTKTLSDARYLQSFTETDPVWTAASSNYYTKTLSDARYQAALSGTGFVKMSGGVISYDNTTYATVNQTTLTGLVKGNGTVLSVASSGTDYSAGTSGLSTGILKSTTTTGALTIAIAADFPTLNQNTTGTAANITGVLNAGSFPALTGDVTNTAGSLSTTVGAIKNVAVPALAAGFFKYTGSAWSFDNTTYATVNQTTVNGIPKGNGSSFSVATAGSDYSAGTAGLSTGILKSTTTTGALTIAIAADFPTLNQNTTGTAANITGVLLAASFPALTGDITTSAGSLATTLASVVTAGSCTSCNITYDDKGRITVAASGTGGGDMVLASVQTVTGAKTFNAGTLITAAGSTTAAPFTFTSGTNLTTAALGAWEFDGKALYFTPIATARGVVPAYQFASVPSGTVALASATGLQAVFASTNDVVNLAANTTYLFQGTYVLTKGTVTTCTVNTGFTYSGTMTSIAYWANGTSASADANATGQTVYIDRLTSTGVTSTGVAAGVVIHISGMLRTSTAGTLTPQVAFSAAPGGTNTVNVNTYFEIRSVGADTVTSVGAWQ